MTAKHTPGHWRIGDAGLTVFGPPNGNPSPEKIARTRNRANARLIAAAPDLLALVQEILSDELASLAPGTIERARAAIAKATGEAP